MFLKNKTDWNLLAKYMAGETDTKETDAVKAWVEYSAENRALLHEIKTDWNNMESMNVRFDVDHAWNKIQNRIMTESPMVEMPVPDKPGSIIRYFNYPMRIAASILMLAVLGIALFSGIERFQNIQVTTSANEKGKVVELPDGSSVYMNHNTHLSYSKNFGSRHREVRLDGEAFFEVTPDKEKPFSIYAGSARVRVLGTSFNVNSRKNDHHVEVYVSTGLVELSENRSQNNRVMLQAGNIGWIDDKAIDLRKADNANSIAWKTGTMTFTDAPLNEVIELLSNVYNVNISVKGNGIDTIRINGSYQDDPLDRILQVISLHNPQLTIAKSADTVYLSQ